MISAISRTLGASLGLGPSARAHKARLDSELQERIAIRPGMTFHYPWEQIKYGGFRDLKYPYDAIGIYANDVPLEKPGYVESTEFQVMLSAACRKAIERIAEVHKINPEGVLKQYAVHVYRRPDLRYWDNGKIFYRHISLDVTA